MHTSGQTLDRNTKARVAAVIGEAKDGVSVTEQVADLSERYPHLERDLRSVGYRGPDVVKLFVLDASRHNRMGDVNNEVFRRILS